MNNILFLYTDPREKEDLKLAADALKTVLRKFRKSAVISFFNIDLSPTCLSEVKRILTKKISECNCIMFCGKKYSLSTEILLFKECFSIHTAQYHSSGKCICYPITTDCCKEKDGIIKLSSETDISSIENCIKIAVNTAFSKKELLLCTDSEKEFDRLIYNEFTNSMAEARGFYTEHFDFNEMICLLSGKIPSSDVIVTTKDNARVLAIHLNALNKFPTGYTVLHGNKVRIYKKEVLSYEDFSNLPYASCLTVCAGMIENELGFKNAGMHLRKAVSKALEKCAFETRSDFQKHLLVELNKPIRHRKVKTNEGNN